MSWVNHTGTKRHVANTRIERLKAHASFRKYIIHCIERDQEKFGHDLEGMTLRGAVERRIQDIDNKLNNSGIWKTLQKFVEQNRQEKSDAINILHPEEQSRLRESINVFNKSEFRERKMREMDRVWASSTSTFVRPSKKDFNAVGMFCKLELHNLNRDRAAAYDFTNKAYVSKREVYLPESKGAQEGEDNIYERVFVPVTPGMNTGAPPKDDPLKKPSAYILSVMGDTPGLKLKEATTTVFTPRMREMCDKYDDIKQVFFSVSAHRVKHGVDLQCSRVGNVSSTWIDRFLLTTRANFSVGCKRIAHFPDSQFSGRLVNKPGSILREFGDVAGLHHATATTHRRVTAGMMAGHSYLSTQVRFFPKIAHRER